MKPMTKYIALRLITSSILLLIYFLTSNYIFLISLFISLIFKCEYEIDEYDPMPELTKLCQNTTYRTQIYGMISLLLCLLLYKNNLIILSYVSLVIGMYLTKVHNYIWFYRKDGTMVDGIYTIEEIDKLK